jgi:hypothetical protein|tara:strand:+ start:115 stop:246 length:132 start_codon:yes stop_codon:yes gene_type:complete
MTKSGHCCAGCCENTDHIHNQNKEKFISEASKHNTDDFSKKSN